MKEPLFTAAGEALPALPWPDYPRPRLRRESFLNLNGRWQFAVSQSGEAPAAYDRDILVPFCPESGLSGIGEHFAEGSFLFYRRVFSLPDGFNAGRVLLHADGADQTLDCFLNGRRLGGHTGGYEAAEFELTGALLPGENELVLRITDDLRSHVQPYGKQVERPGGMWYTPVSGLWQTVWLESVPQTYIRRADFACTLDEAVLDVGDERLFGTVTVADPDGAFTAPLERGRAVLRPEKPRRWSPETPFLYPVVIEAGADKVESYFALRTLEVKTVGGHARLCLNGAPYFFHGVLDQGYWSDGIFTPASPAAYDEDILAMKALGFNTLRKHIKVEPPLFYYACDHLGMAVFQDMVNNGDYNYRRDTVLPNLGFQTRRGDEKMHPDPEARAAFLAGMEATVAALKSHPCVVYWTIFNEGWGQFDSTAAYRKLRSLDASRFIDSTSGWFRCGETDVDSRHVYFGPWNLKAGEKPLVLTEFGGLTLPVEGHLQCPGRSYGYGACKSAEELERRVLALYEKRVLPLVEQGLCAAIYTQLSDVEEEVNGLLTADRKVCKLKAAPMRALAERLAEAANASCREPSAPAR